MTAKKATPVTKKAPVKPPVKNNPGPPPELQIKPVGEVTDELEDVIIPTETQAGPPPEGIQLNQPVGYDTKTVNGVSRYTCHKCGVMFMGSDREVMIRAHVGVCKKR